MPSSSAAQGKYVKVTEASLTYVAIDDTGQATRDSQIRAARHTGCAGPAVAPGRPMQAPASVTRP